MLEKYRKSGMYNLLNLCDLCVYVVKENLLETIILLPVNGFEKKS